MKRVVATSTSNPAKGRVDAYFSEAARHIRNGYLSKALESALNAQIALRPTPPDSPENRHVHSMLIQIYQGLGFYNDAAGCLTELIRITPAPETRMDYYLVQAHIYGQADQWSNALESLSNAESILNSHFSPESAKPIWHQLALVSEKLGYLDDAFRYHFKIVDSEIGHDPSEPIDRLLYLMSAALRFDRPDLATRCQDVLIARYETVLTSEQTTQLNWVRLLQERSSPSGPSVGRTKVLLAALETPAERRTVVVSICQTLLEQKRWERASSFFDVFESEFSGLIDTEERTTWDNMRLFCAFQQNATSRCAIEMDKALEWTRRHTPDRLNDLLIKQAQIAIEYGATDLAQDRITRISADYFSPELMGLTARFGTESTVTSFFVRRLALPGYVDRLSPEYQDLFFTVYMTALAKRLFNLGRSSISSPDIQFVLN
ncbi:hypothetical protein EBR96_05800, partial [bacterium]|nr:hypothetical protein [bacterium]